MKFKPTVLEGAYLIDLDKIEDERGFFARAFCTKEFSSHGLVEAFVQINNSMAKLKGTMRGMHYQLAPHAETKIVRCVRGSVYDVIIDIRENSPSFGQHFGDVLSDENRRMMYVPKGFAHGFVTLEDHTEVVYFVDEFYAPDFERGIRWNDPHFNIEWPLIPTTISEKDQHHMDFDHKYHLGSNTVNLR